MLLKYKNGEALSEAYRKLMQFLTGVPSGVSSAFPGIDRPQSLILAKMLGLIEFNENNFALKSNYNSQPKAQTFQNFFDQSGTPREKTIRKLYFFYLIMYRHHDIVLRIRSENETIINEYIAMKSIANQIANFFRLPPRRLVDEFAIVANEKINIVGDYAFIRPAPYEPLSKILLGRLLIGTGSIKIDKSQSRKLNDREVVVLGDIESRAVDGPTQLDMYRDLVGFHVPLDLNAILFLRNPSDASSRFIGYISQVDFHHPDYPNIRGILTADTAHKHAASAWPFIAIKSESLTDSQLVTGVRPLNSLNDELLIRLVRSQLKRGAVYWDEQHFPPHLEL